MNIKVKNQINIICYMSFLFGLFFMFLQNVENPWILILMSTLEITSYTIRNFFIYSIEKYKSYGKLIFILDLLILYLISRGDNGIGSLFFYPVVIADMTLNYSNSFGAFSTMILLTTYDLQMFLKTSKSVPMVIFQRIVLSFVCFLIFYFAIYIIKYVLMQNCVIEETLEKLTVKTLEQEITYEKLKAAYEKVEELTVLQERNRIAREIHDTLGHTLTTAIVEIEAGKILAEKDVKLGVEKFELAHEQVCKGLKDLRASVRMLSGEDELIDFAASIESLIKETERHTGVIVRYNIKEIPQINKSIKRTLYRALQEGLTNGIKHGKSTAFVFNLFEKENNIVFFLQDNGKGCSEVAAGFGLKSMGERVKEHNGSMEIESKQNEGLSLMISIPFGGISYGEN